MITLLINIILTNINLFSCGLIFSKFFSKEISLKNRILELPLFGIIFLSFIILIINFIYPISKIVGTTIFLITIIFFIFEITNNKLLRKKIFKLIVLSSIITFLLIVYSNIYRPDAGLYHLPFISMLNENKIIFGSANINFRFGVTSIAQYLSASQNNFIYDLRAISIPLASVFSFFIIFILKETRNSLNSQEVLKSTILFLIISFSLISFGRYSNYGNDTISHIYFFILIIFILNNFKKLNKDINIFNKLSLISIFLFASKAFMSLILILPFIFFLTHNKKKEIFKNQFNYFNILIFLAWLVKSLAISGCIIYPVSKTCVDNLIIYDKVKTINEQKSGEAWAKDWVNQKKIKLKFEEYNQNFNWLNTWSNNHFKKIIEKLTPYFVFLLLFTISLLFCKKKSRVPLSNKIHLLYLVSLILTTVWFLKFPLYRYGTAFLASSIILTFVYFVNFIKIMPEINSLKKIFRIFLYICFVAFITKNFIRIYKNSYILNHNYWPDIYSENNKNIINKFPEIKDDNKTLYFYSMGNLCMYSNSPCTNFKIENLNKRKIYTYDLYWLR